MSDASALGAGFKGAFEGLFGGAGDSGTIHQVFTWSIIGAIVSAALTPFITGLQESTNAAFPETALAPADLVDLVIKSHITLDAGASQAARSGINATRFAQLVEAAGEPPGPTDLAGMLRGGLIPEAGTGPHATSYEQGLKESRLNDKWIPLLEAVAQNGIPGAELVDARVEGQITEQEYRRRGKLAGFNDDDLTILFNTRGNPPSPAELIDLVRRGFIPLHGVGPDVVSLQQGVYEGATKDKWEPLYEKLTEYLPPPRTVTALQRAGSITESQALALYKQQGLSDELAQAYVQNASGEKLAPDKQLAKATVLALYEQQVIPADQATTMLKALGYSDAESAFLLELQDLGRSIKAVNSAVTRIQSLYIGRKIDRTSAINALNTLRVPAAQVNELVQTWDLERQSTVKLLTESQIVDAWYYKIIDQGTAETELVGIGYTPLDAWILLSNKNKAALPGRPAPGPSVTGLAI